MGKGRQVVPIGQLERRLPQGGRIRIGSSTPTQKNGKEYKRPKKLDKFRFTSHDKAAIEEIAAAHGGTVKEWKGSPDGTQWEVFCEQAEIPIMLPPDPLGGSPVYEMWQAGGCIRRCDGEECVRPQEGPDGTELVTVPCLCFAAQELSCKITTRLTVLLPNIRFGGAWMLETHGFHAAHELPGMVAVVAELQAQGISRALLAAEQRRQVVFGETRDYVVPVIRLGLSPDDLISGRALVSPATRAAIEVGAQGQLDTGALVDDFDDAIEVEVVDPGPRALDSPVAPPEAVGDTGHKRLMIRLRELKVDDDTRHHLCFLASDGRTRSSTELTAGEVEQVTTIAELVDAGGLSLVAEGPGGEPILFAPGHADPVVMPLDLGKARAWLGKHRRAPEQPPLPDGPPA
jgi:hypothetical protein